jgi:hypothetical protein
VNDVVLVHIRDGLNQVVDDLLRLSLGVRVLLDDSLEQLAALHQLGHELEELFGLVHREELHHEVAVELLEDLNLLLQPRPILRRETLLDDLFDRVHATLLHPRIARMRTPSEIHGREGARAQPLALLEITSGEAVMRVVAFALSGRFGHRSAHLVRRGPTDQWCQSFGAPARKR